MSTLHLGAQHWSSQRQKPQGWATSQTKAKEGPRALGQRHWRDAGVYGRGFALPSRVLGRGKEQGAVALVQPERQDRHLGRSTCMRAEVPPGEMSLCRAPREARGIEGSPQVSPPSASPLTS